MQQQEEQQLYFELINPAFSPNKGITCHIVAAWDQGFISGQEVMLQHIDEIEVFEFTEEEDHQNGRQEEEDKDEEDEDEEEEEEHGHGHGHGHSDEQEHELPIHHLDEKEKEAYIQSIQPGANNQAQKKGGSSVSKQSPQLITTTNLVKFLSKSAK